MSVNVMILVDEKTLAEREKGNGNYYRENSTGYLEMQIYKMQACMGI